MIHYSRHYRHQGTPIEPAALDSVQIQRGGLCRRQARHRHVLHRGAARPPAIGRYHLPQPHRSVLFRAPRASSGTGARLGQFHVRDRQGQLAIVSRPQESGDTDAFLAIASSSVATITITNIQQTYNKHTTPIRTDDTRQDDNNDINDIALALRWGACVQMLLILILLLLLIMQLF